MLGSKYKPPANYQSSQLHMANPKVPECNAESSKQSACMNRLHMCMFTMCSHNISALACMYLHTCGSSRKATLFKQLIYIDMRSHNTAHINVLPAIAEFIHVIEHVLLHMFNAIHNFTQHICPSIYNLLEYII